VPSAVMKWGLIVHAVSSLVIAAASVVAQVAAPDGPDFSGRWVLESTPQSAVDISRALSVSQSVVRTNVRGEPIGPFFKDIMVVRNLANGARSEETYQIGVVGGTVFARRADGTVEPSTYRRVGWEGQTLVIESGSYTGPTRESGQWTEQREVWSLDSSERLRLTITTRSSVGTASTVTLVYRRQ
jgi:hypothetical protein